MTTLLLVRHGETVDNVNQILQGQTQGELNETGVEQAEKLARKLSNTLFLNLIAQQYPNQTVLAVGHGIINKAIQSVFYDKEMHEVEKMGNAEVRVLMVKGDWKGKK